MAYEITEEGGMRLRGADDVIMSLDPEAEFGLLYDADSRNGGRCANVLEHGPAQSVLLRYRARWAAIQMAACSDHMQHKLGSMLGELGAVQSAREILREMASDLRIVVIPVREVTDPVLAEINACLATTGRVGSLEQRLAALNASGQTAEGIDTRHDVGLGDDGGLGMRP